MGKQLKNKVDKLTEDQGYEYIGGTEDAVNRIRYAGRTDQMNATYTF